MGGKKKHETRVERTRVTRARAHARTRHTYVRTRTNAMNRHREVGWLIAQGERATPGNHGWEGEIRGAGAGNRRRQRHVYRIRENR